MTSDMLRELLAIRDLLMSIADQASGLGYDDELPEIAEMQKLERSAFEKINEWSKP